MGAFVFGLVADRYGRRLPLMIDLVFFSICEVATGLAPNYTTFMVLRALFGIGMGGEWGVGASLAMEKVPARLRICWQLSYTSSCSSTGAGGPFSSLEDCPRSSLFSSVTA